MGKLGNIASKVGGAMGNLKNMAKMNAEDLKENAKALAKDLAKKFIKAIPPVVKAKIIAIAIIAGVIVVLIAALVQLLQDIFGKSDKATSIKVTTAEFQQQASPESLELYNKYGSCIGFTLDQINELSDEVTNENGVFKSNDILREAYSSKFGYITKDKKNGNIEKEYNKLLDENGNLADNLTDYQLQIVKYYQSLRGDVKNSISIYDNVPIYTHCLRAEKYNFNNISWKAYNHGESVKDVEDFAYDSNLGLYYPTKGGVPLTTFIKEYSPYLLSSKIPAAYLGASNYSIEHSTPIGKSQTSWYDENVQGMKSEVGNFAYLTLQYAQSDIVVNQYNLKYQNELTSWEEYDTYSAKPSYQVKKVRHETTRPKNNNSNTNTTNTTNTTTDNGWGNEVETIVYYTYEYVPGSYNDGRQDRSNKVETHNTRENNGTIDFKLENHEEWGESIHTYYKISKAATFDVNMNWSYDYSQYEQSDVDNRINQDKSYDERAEEFNRLPEGVTVQSEAELSVGNLEDAFNSGTGDGNVRTCYGNEYKYEFGNKKYIRRQWEDKLNPEPTNQKKYLYGIKDLVNYNTNPKNDQNMQKVSADEFNSDKKSVDYYQINIIDTDKLALNLVDMFNANPKLYQKYVSSTMAYSKYVGWTRNKYVIQQGDDSIESAFKQLATDNGGTLPFAYGASFGFDVGAEEAPVYNASGSTTGKRLMYEYIYQLEGTGTMKEENGIKYYQIYTINGNRTVGHGLDLETSGKEGDLKALLERAGLSTSLNKGDWVQADIVDTVLDGEIENWYNIIMSATAGLNLQEYQIHALTSRAVNAGYHSYLKYGSSPCNSSTDLVSAYNAHWNQDRDSKYEMLFEKYGGADLDSSQEADVYSNVDYNNGLFSSYMAGPNNGGQLDNRRKSEWVLFQTGFYGFNTNIKKLYGMSGGSILECAEYVHAYMEDNNYTYCVYHSNGYEECVADNPTGSGITHTHRGSHGECSQLCQTFEESQGGNHTTCCATFVMWVLQEAGYLEDNEGSHSANALASILENQKGFIRYPTSEAEAGDVLVYSGHIEIYAGDGTKYNAGSGTAIRRDSPYSFGNPANDSSILYCLRAPN